MSGYVSSVQFPMFEHVSKLRLLRHRPHRKSAALSTAEIRGGTAAAVYSNLTKSGSNAALPPKKK